MTTTDTPKVHEGRNIKRFREMLGIKQDALAAELGEDWTQKKISLLEQKETVEPEILEQVAKALKVSPEAIGALARKPLLILSLAPYMTMPVQLIIIAPLLSIRLINGWKPWLKIKPYMSGY